MSNALVEDIPITLKDHGGGIFGSAPVSEEITEDWTGWSYNAQNGGVITLVESNELKAEYPTNANGVLVWSNKNIYSLDTKELYISFEAKMPNLKHGMKFLKIFGKSSSGYANCTLGLDYTGVDDGALRVISFGDGTTSTNDTQQILKLDGTNSSAIGRSFGSASVSTPQSAAFGSSDWGTGYHTFKFHIKFNSGTTSENEVNDGVFYLKIDNDVYVDATGLFNRHYTNDSINKLEFFGYTTNGPSGGFDMTIINPRYSTTGF